MANENMQRRGTLLHVEDDEMVARIIATLLRRSGFDIVSVPTAEAAIVELGSRRFDAIVSDFNLAGPGTGADVLAAAGATPFLFLSSDERAGGYGVPWLDKPSAPSDIIAAIESIARKAA